MPTHEVIIDFQTDFTGLSKGIDALENLGLVDEKLASQFKKTNTEISNQGDTLRKTAADSQQPVKNFTRLQQLMQQFPKTGFNRFMLEVGQQLADAGFDAETFGKKAKKGLEEPIEKSVSLRTELKNIREQMAQAALAGGTLSEEYLKLKEQAGKLDDTIKDVSQDIANAGSDTRGIDNVIGSVSALAGGFSAVQGAAALFGNESEEVQKALLKVNAAMALATGIQQVANAVTKQGSLVRLADATATGFQIAAQRVYTFVTGRATAATVAFKVALATTGIGLLVVGILALVEAFSSMSDEAENATKALDKQNEALDRNFKAISDNLDIRIAKAKAAGAAESEILRKEEIRLIREKASLQQQNQNIKALIDGTKLSTKVHNEYAETYNKNADRLTQIAKEQTINQIEQEAAVSDERQKSFEKQKELNDKALENARKQRAAGFADFKAGIELRLLAAAKGSEEELAIRKELLRAELQIDLEGENLTQNQRKLLIQKFFKERKELEKSFNKEAISSAIENDKLLLEAQLQNLNLSEEDKLGVKIYFLQLSAAEEIISAEGNASKIKLINAKLNADISAAKVESIRKSANDEAALLAATGGAGKRALQSVSENEKLKSDIRINAIRQIEQIDLAAIERQIKANRDANKVIGADHKALEIEYEQLQDQKAQVTEANEKKITEINAAENRKRRDDNIAYIQATIGGLQQLSDIAASINETNQQNADQFIAQKKKELQDAIDAGAISEKEAKARAKRIEAEERAVKNKAAQQQKNLAVFNALLAIPQAFIAGLTAPFPIGGPIYGAILAALAAAQAGIIASRPVPKFFTGKKGSYKGLAEVHKGELIERNNRMEVVVRNKQIVYLGSKDKVFTAGETREKLKKMNETIRQPFVNKEAINQKKNGHEFDYNKLANVISKGYKPQKGTNINIDKYFISESVSNGLSRVNYYNRYYSSK